MAFPRIRIAGAVVVALAALASSAVAATSHQAAPSRPVAVLISGGTTQAPFTTPTTACRQGRPAGGNFTALRSSLLAAGIDPYTVPVMNGPGVAKSTAMLNAFKFAQCPQLPANVTVDSTEALTQAGPKLVAFLNVLRARYGVERVSLVGWSYGGQVARAAIRLLRDSGSPITVTSLVTIGSPWTGMYPNDIVMGEAPISVCKRQPTCLATAVGAGFEATPAIRAGVVGQLTESRMTAWNADQVGVLDDVPVTAIAGDRVRLASGSSRAWPNDALVQASSALATDVPAAVVPRITRLTFNDVHSATMVWQWQLLLGKTTSLTEDPKVLAVVAQAVKDGAAGVG